MAKQHNLVFNTNDSAPDELAADINKALRRFTRPKVVDLSGEVEIGEDGYVVWAILERGDRRPMVEVVARFNEEWSADE